MLILNRNLELEKTEILKVLNNKKVFLKKYLNEYNTNLLKKSKNSKKSKDFNKKKQKKK